MEQENLKRCSCCKASLPVSNFSKNKAQRDGLNGHCRKCVSINQKKRSSHKTATVRNPQYVGISDKELFEELKYRGYKGQLYFTETVTRSIKL